MGINHTHQHSDIRIKKKHLDDAADAMIGDDTLNSIVDLDATMNIETVFKCLDWECKFDKHSGDLADLSTSSERPYGMEEMAHAIAPYVEAGSYIRMIAHTDGDIVFRWFFDGNQCIEQEMYSRGGIEIWTPEAAAKNTFKVNVDIQSRFVFDVRADSQEEAEELLAKKLRNKMRAALEDGTYFMSTTRLKRCDIHSKKTAKAAKKKSKPKKYHEKIGPNGRKAAVKKVKKKGSRK